MPIGKLNQAVEAYLTDLRRIRASGGATNERSLYGPLANLLNAVGSTLKPKVFCVQELADQPGLCRLFTRCSGGKNRLTALDTEPSRSDGEPACRVPWER